MLWAFKPLIKLKRRLQAHALVASTSLQVLQVPEPIPASPAYIYSYQRAEGIASANYAGPTALEPARSSMKQYLRL